MVVCGFVGLGVFCVGSRVWNIWASAFGTGLLFEVFESVVLANNLMLTTVGSDDFAMSAFFASDNSARAVVVVVSHFCLP